MRKFFDINDNLEKIIKENLDDNNAETFRISNGWTNFVYKAISNGKTYFFRFPRNDFFSKALVKEVEFNHYIKNKITYKTTNLEIFYDRNKPFSKHEQIEGKNLYEVFDIMTQSQKENLAKQISLFIKELQEVDFTDFKEYIKLSTFLNELAIISKHGKFDYDFSYHDELIFRENTEKLVLNHGDLNPGNILINEKMKIEAILDFAFCSVSSSICDLSRIIGRLPENFYDTMINNYEKIFNLNVDKISLDKHIKMWNYIDNNYIEYMKSACPDVVVPKI